jgi:hypothetical protein
LSIHEDEARSTITSTTGGVMTKDVGAITGDLEITTRPSDTGIIEVTVRYAEASEWYVVEGSPFQAADTGGLSLPELHKRMMEHLTTPGPVVEGNEQPVSLLSFSP